MNPLDNIQVGVRYKEGIDNSWITEFQNQLSIPQENIYVVEQTSEIVAFSGETVDAILIVIKDNIGAVIINPMIYDLFKLSIKTLVAKVGKLRFTKIQGGKVSTEIPCRINLSYIDEKGKQLNAKFVGEKNNEVSNKIVDEFFSIVKDDKERLFENIDIVDIRDNKKIIHISRNPDTGQWEASNYKFIRDIEKLANDHLSS